MIYDHQKLKTVIDSEPDNSSRTDEDILIWLNAKRTIRAKADTEKLVRYMAEEGIWSNMNSSSDPVVISAKSELDMLTQRLPTIDTRATRFVTMIDTLITKNVVTEDQKNAILAMSDDQQTPLQESGISRAVLGDVIFARGL